jgi:hypothetical protein
MTKYEIKEVNTQTGEEIIREATAKEITQIKADEAESAALKADSAAKALEKTALLKRLGITADEAALLLS